MTDSFHILPSSLTFKDDILQCGPLVPGAEAMLLKDLLGTHPKHTLIYLVKSSDHLEDLESLLKFTCPGREILRFDPWDTVPYDRGSPNPEIVSNRLEVLTRLLALKDAPNPPIVITSLGAFLQKLPPRSALAQGALILKSGARVDREHLNRYLVQFGYHRVSTVREAGEYAVRGGIMDLFPQGFKNPVRLDFFGDELEKIRPFDAMSQCSLGVTLEVILRPIGEVLFNEETLVRFRGEYLKAFGAAAAKDPLYESVSQGNRYPGFENWLPLFYDSLETLREYVTNPLYVLEDQGINALSHRIEQIQEHFNSRQSLEGTVAYRALPPSALYMTHKEAISVLSSAPQIQTHLFEMPQGVSLQCRPLPDYTQARLDPTQDLIQQVLKDIKGWQGEGKSVAIACPSTHTQERLSHLLKDHGYESFKTLQTLSQIQSLQGTLGILSVPFFKSFKTESLVILADQDIFGERQSRAPKARKKSELFFSELSTLRPGDLIVHQDHGIGRYEGLSIIEVGGADHDCVALTYGGGDKLFVPVENLDVLTRYGGADSAAELDRLGNTHWQVRKAKVKERIKLIADHLLNLAALRSLRSVEGVEPIEGLYDEFCARFPYPETDDQLRAIEEVLEDLKGPKPMDRLVCGDVGFGKTEIALRAAFVVAASGKQVALVVPTTLLCRQHFQNFQRRFEGFGLRVEMLSRLVTPKHSKQIKIDLQEGKVDVVVATHALLAKNMEINNLGLLIVDEEQHFGVSQKERLKSLKADIHVLTLTATPIPRTLQMALGGVREMSIIATPPIDRMAVRTFVIPFDEMVIREALLREHHRGGQIFYVCPRISDLEEVATILARIAPELRVIQAHGAMTPTVLEDAMDAFCEGRYDVLLATNIIESGIDITNANTMIIHRPDLFGLAQLYQLRGRIGRSKVRAYAYLTLDPKRALSEASQKRLEVMQSLDTLGAGFQIASHDMDIRGAGNLVGEEQSGHIKEVGVELYQHLLEEAIQKAKYEKTQEVPPPDHWSPQINLGLSVLIPEEYVSDLDVRLGLYQRLTQVDDPQDLTEFSRELQDRFGKLPLEVKNLLNIVSLKILCRKAHIEKIDAGPKGAVLTFYENTFPEPEKLLRYLQTCFLTVKLRPDHKLVVLKDWPDLQTRALTLQKLLQELGQVRKN